MSRWHLCAFRIHSAVFSGFVLLSGCASVDPGPDYDRVADYVAEATGDDSLYRPGDEEAARERIEELLEDGLEREEAVQIALLNNRDLQGKLLEVGVARADAVQAGLLSNPSLGAVVRFPTRGGPVDTEVELVQNLIELWQIPARKRVAEKQVRKRILETAREAASLAVRTRKQFYSTVTAERSLEIEEENSRILQDLLNLTTERQQAGAATEIDVNVVRSELLEQQIATEEARLELLERKRRLSGLLGLDIRPGEIRLADSLPTAVKGTISEERVLELARAHRLDLEASREVVESATEKVELERRLFLRSVAPGVGLESSGTSDVAIGPALDVELPIFDQNQAGIAKAELRLEQASKSLEALELAVTREVRAACDRFLSAVEVLALYSDRLMPLQRENLELSQESFRLGRTGFLSVLQAERSYVAARRSYTEQLEVFALTLPELERVSGQPLSSVLLPSGPESSTQDPESPGK